MKWSFLPPVYGDDLQVDPAEILSQMARDPATPATARLAACRELLRLKKKPPRAPEAQQEEAGDELQRRAIAILSKGALH